MSINEKSKIIFAENYIGSIATINDDGTPWSTPLHMVADNNAVYWFSKSDKRHSRNIARDPRVSLSLFSCDVSRGLRGVYVNGEAQLLTPDERQAAYELMRQRVGDGMPPGIGEVEGYRLPIGRVDEEKSTGNCWYFYG